MAVDDDVLHGARNAFLVMILALVGIAVYQFVTAGLIDPAITATWLLGAVVYYGSKWYYGRESGSDAAETAAPGEEN